MSYKLNVPLSVYLELTTLIYKLSEKGYSVCHEMRGYTKYGELFSFVQTANRTIKPKKSQQFEIDGEVEYRSSVQDIIDYKNKLSALLASLEKEAA